MAFKGDSGRWGEATLIRVAEIDGMSIVQVTAKPGRTLREMEEGVDRIMAEFLERGVTDREIQTSLNNKEAQLVRQLATVLGKANDSTLAAFNPFTTAPVEGTNWKKGAAYGTPLSRWAYELPRTYDFSVGVRF